MLGNASFHLQKGREPDVLLSHLYPEHNTDACSCLAQFRLVWHHFHEKKKKLFKNQNVK